MGCSWEGGISSARWLPSSGDTAREGTAVRCLPSALPGDQCPASAGEGGSLDAPWGPLQASRPLLEVHSELAALTVPKPVGLRWSSQSWVSCHLDS